MFIICAIAYLLGYNIPTWLWTITIIELVIQYVKDNPNTDYKERVLK